MKLTAPIAVMSRLERIRKIAESIHCVEGSELDSLLANITGACDLAIEEILRANLPDVRLENRCNPLAK